MRQIHYIGLDVCARTIDLCAVDGDGPPRSAPPLLRDRRDRQRKLAVQTPRLTGWLAPPRCPPFCRRAHGPQEQALRAAAEQAAVLDRRSPQQPLQNAGDISLAGGLATSPAWAPWLDRVNEVLTTGTLLIGLVLGLARLWVAFKDWRQSQRPQ